MTGAQLNTLINYKCRSTDTSFPLADKLVLVNIFKDEIAGKIQERRPDFYNTGLLQNLVANTRAYILPTDILNRIITIELDLDNDGVYELAIPFQKLQYRDGSSESTIASNFNGERDYYISGGYLYLNTGTIGNVTNGLKWVYDAFPADLANLTGSTELAINSLTAKGIPRQVQELVARRVSIAYKSRNKIALDPEDLSYAIDLEDVLDNMAITLVDEQLTGKLPETQTDNGYDL